MKHLFVANWKMRMSNENIINYCHDNKAALLALSTNKHIVICPPFTALSTITSTLKKNSIFVGAQDCSAFEPGAYTGQIAARHLAELNCTYCIVGHSERRTYCGETDETIAEKTKRLIENNITPIICIGETAVECIVETTYQTLKKQLIPVFTALNNYKKTNTTIIIAYEPTWAIGTSVIPENNYLTAIFRWLQQQSIQQLPNHNVILLYGGNVNEHTITQLITIQNINGFLIGSASTNFEQFKSIIEACDTIL